MIDSNTNQENFLNFISTKSKRLRHTLKEDPLIPINDLPETTLSGKNQSELLEIAKKNSQAVHVSFKTTSKNNLANVLNDYLLEKKINKLILPTVSFWDKYNLKDWKSSKNATYWEIGANRKDNIKKANDAEGAIGFADYLLAESGTITVATTPGQGRSFHFLPTHYLSIIKKSNILPRSRQAMDKYEELIKSKKLETSNINFITGPSNSGDIEMSLIVGVHGPLDVTYVVVDDM